MRPYKCGKPSSASSGASHRIGDQCLTVPADPAGYRQLIAFGRRHGATLWAIEGTGRFGAGLTTALLACCERVVELGHGRPPAGSPDTEASPGTGASPGTLASVAGTLGSAAAGTTAAIPTAAGTGRHESWREPGRRSQLWCRGSDGWGHSRTHCFVHSGFGVNTY
jgi:hypothetical protein